MNKFIFITLISTIGCTRFSNSQPDLTSKELDNLEVDGSLVALDRTIDSMEKMIEDMERMNRNLDAIFEAVTDCKSVNECQELKEEMHQKYQLEQSRNPEEK